MSAKKVFSSGVFVALLAACSSPYEEVVLEDASGSELAVSRIFSDNSVPDRLADDLLLLAERTVGPEFQINSINEVSSTNMDANFEGPGTDRVLLIDRICGRMTLDARRSVSFGYVFLTAKERQVVIKQTRVFAVGKGECGDFDAENARPEKTTTAEGSP